MLPPYTPLFTWLRATTVGQLVCFAGGLLFTYIGYLFWQAVAAVVYFFAFGSGDGHHDELLLVEAGGVLLHLGVVSWLGWRRVLYPTWGAWAIGVGVPIGLFAHYILLPWYQTPPGPSYQQFSFLKGSHRYQLTLERPGNGFDVSVAGLRTGSSSVATSTSLLMGNYRVRHDTIFLREWQGPRQCFIYHHTLVGFENSPLPIALTREPDSTPFSLRQGK